MAMENDILLLYPPISIPGEFFIEAIQFKPGMRVDFLLDDSLRRSIYLGDSAWGPEAMSRITYNSLHLDSFLNDAKPGNHRVELIAFDPDGHEIKRLSATIVTPEILKMPKQTRIIFDNESLFIEKCIITYDSSFPLQKALFSQDGAAYQRSVIPDSNLEVLVIENIRNTDRVSLPVPIEAIDTMELFLASEGRHHVWKWGKGISLFIYEEALTKLLSHCHIYGQSNLEVMGFLLGDVYKWKEREYTVVRDVVTTELDTTSVSVKFKSDAFERLFEAMDKLPYDYLLVGWYHSHPGHRCYLSTKDVETQTKLFKSAYHTAVVMDPHNIEMKAYKVTSGEKVVEISYAVFGPGPAKVL